MATVRIQIRRGTAAEWASVDPVLAGGEMGLETDTGKFKFGDGSTAWTALDYALADQIDDYIPLSEKGNPGGVATLNSDGQVPLGQLGLLIDGAPALLNTLDEIANALGDDANLSVTLTNSIGSVASDVSDLQDSTSAAFNSILVTGVTLPAATAIGNTTSEEITYLHGVTSAIQTQIDDANTAIGAAITTAGSYTDGAISTAVTAHNNDSTNVHGILDTADLVVSAQMATDISAAVSTHNGLGISVHGISNTANLVYIEDLSDHATETESVHGIADTAQLETLSGATGKANAAQAAAEATAAADATTKANAAQAAAEATAAADATTKANAAQAAAEATAAADATTKANAAQAAAEATAAAALTAHGNDTTGVHGITDTSKLALLDAADQTFTGNMEVDGNLVVDGNFTVNGTNFSASATSIVIEDNLVQLAHQNSANTVDLGIVVAYNDGAAKHAGLVRDVSDAKWKLFKGVTTEPATTVDFTEGSLDDLKVAAFEATTVTPSSGVVFSDGTQTKAGVPSITPITEKTANYTLSSLTERDTLIEVNHTGGTAVTITIPSDATVNYPVGTSIDILRTNTGEVTIAGSGATVNATPGLKLRAQWSTATLFKRGANSWVVFGDLKA